MLMSAVLATAMQVRNGKNRSIGRSGAPIWTTFSSTLPSSLTTLSMSPCGITAITEIATSM